MMDGDNRDEIREKPLLVRDVVARHDRRQVPLTKGSTPVESLAEAIEWFRHSRQLYVVDEEGRLLGNITLARLVTFVFARSHGTSVAPRRIVNLLTCETARDLMTEGTLSARMDEDLDELLERMAAGNVDEVPVVDDEGRVIADLTMIDLLRALS